MNWVKAAAAVDWNVKPFIDGRYRSSSSTESFDNINPATETTLCRVSTGSAADVDEAVRIARKRFDSGCWSESQPSERGQVLLKLADLIIQSKEAFALLDSMEMGKPVQASLYDAGTFAPAILRSFAGFADKLFGETVPLGSRTLALNVYEPRGVIGAIVPWNFPLVNAVIKLAPALAAGNTVVLKPSELASSSALKLAELAVQAGVPEGVLNVVPGLGSTVGAALALHSDVDLISFTGSTTTGRRIMQLCGSSNGKPLLLECGGKSPHVVFDDVSNLDKVADAVVQSALRNQGQVCVAHTRVISNRRVKEALLESIVDRARRYRLGDPLDISTTFGPLASAVQRDRVKGYIRQALDAGAEARLLGDIRESGGYYVAPTIFDRVSSDMSVVSEEIFGPVLCVQEFTADEEAVALANGTDYGLAATVWTRDMGRAKRLAHAIRAGSISVHTSGEDGPVPEYLLSHEPQKASGFGAEFGTGGMIAYSVLKSITFEGG